jgi:hypothetical protein
MMQPNANNAALLYSYILLLLCYAYPFAFAVMAEPEKRRY